MKKLILLLLIFIISCDNKNHEKEIYRNLNLIVVKVGENEDVTKDKFRKPVTIRNILLKDYNNNYCMITNNSRSYNNAYIPISDSLWFNVKIGDTLHFDYLRKDRFFKIKNR